MTRSRVLMILAIVALVVLPLVPGVVSAGTAAALIRIPIESIVVVLLLAVLPWRAARRVVAIGFGVFLVVALLLAGLDAAFEYALDVPFDPTQWQQVGDGFGVVVDSIGAPAAAGLLILVGVVSVAVGIAAAWAALRVDAAIRSRRRRGRNVVLAVTAAWILAALAGSQLVAGQPAAASASFGSIASTVSVAMATGDAQQSIALQVRDDPYRDVPGSQLLTGLRGKDVIVAFVESYGTVALNDPAISGGVTQVVQDGQAQLEHQGYTIQSAWLTSPTFGGVSWLAHSTLQSGLWITKQSIYDRVLTTDRTTLSEAFTRAGWTTISDVPSDTHPWTAGERFYQYDTMLDTNSVGYHGPSFGYARIPDQYTWKYFSDTYLSKPHDPLMAEIDLVSSHTPWAPLPQLMPWDSIGDGSGYSTQLAGQPTTSEVWSNSPQVKVAYGRSIEYALGSLYSFVQNSDDPNLVLVVLGDHQPAAIVSGENASRDVPISIIAKDPAVFSAISSWDWQDGMLPGADAPVWRMDAFRDRFLSAFG